MYGCFHNSGLTLAAAISHRVGALVAAAGLFCAATAGVISAEPRKQDVLGLPLVNQISDQRAAALGRRLFMDKRLSATGRMSCATCHVPGEGFTQTGRATPEGRNGQPLRRNAPTLLNVGLATPLMHDGAAASLEVQMLTPLLDGNEMGNGSFAEVEARVAAVPGYVTTFAAVFGSPPTIADIGKSLAAYQRSLLSGNSAFDRWRFGGDDQAMPAAGRRGFLLFTGKAGCSGCHDVGQHSAAFTDNLMHNTGVGLAGATRAVKIARHDAATVDFAQGGDRGRHEVTGQPADLYRFRTPTLRNVARTAPYMHDGSIATLTDVVQFYDRGGGANANLDPAIKPLELNDRDIADLVVFLESLTGANIGRLAKEAEAAAPLD
jgi:cytochrome c peroxidase